MTFQDWMNLHPQAAYDLVCMFQQSTALAQAEGEGKSEGWAQAAFRMDAAARGAVYWRNNVGALKAKEVIKCPHCSQPFTHQRAPIRWGLCNDSSKLNDKFKSSDLIGIEPLLVTPAHVGQVVGRFSAREMKKPGWAFNPADPHEAAQAAFGSIVLAKGGDFKFSTGGQ